MSYSHWGPDPKNEAALPSFEEVALEGSSHDYYNETYPSWALDAAMNASDWLDLGKVQCGPTAAYFDQIGTEVSRFGDMLNIKVAGVDGDYRNAASIQIYIDTETLETILTGVARGFGLTK